MSGHADTIRRVLNWPIAYFNEKESAAAWDALDALVAENQQLRDALETTEEWAHEQGYDVLAKRLRAALDGTPSEDT